MAQASIRSDEARIEKELEMSTYEGRYMLNVGGPGLDVPYFEDPQIRLQKNGANLRSNTIGVENDLMCRNRRISRDYINDTYKSMSAKSEPVQYKNKNSFVLESRASHPAWSYRGIDVEYTRFENPWLNPQANLEKDFNDNIQTRLQEKKIIVASGFDSSDWLPINKI
jgi:hypothetical protein